MSPFSLLLIMCFSVYKVSGGDRNGLECDYCKTLSLEQQNRLIQLLIQ